VNAYDFDTRKSDIQQARLSLRQVKREHNIPGLEHSFARHVLPRLEFLRILSRIKLLQERHMRLITTLFSLILATAILSSCGPKAFTKGDYDDVQKENLLNDRWSETDMQKSVQDLVAGMLNSRAIKKATKPPLVMVTNLQNKTSEHIDTQNIMDMVRVELQKTGDVEFVDKEAREDIKNEYDYQNSGMVSDTTKKGPGGQTGADYVMNGRLDSIVQEVGADKTVYYKLTLNLTNLKTGVIVWSDYKQMRKVFEKKRIGM
jgi:uncharacterized protein (TIGR02722 family)